MPQRTECKHLLKDSAFNSLQDRICLRNSLGGGSKPILSHPSMYSSFVSVYILLRACIEQFSSPKDFKFTRLDCITLSLFDNECEILTFSLESNSITYDKGAKNRLNEMVLSEHSKHMKNIWVNL